MASAYALPPRTVGHHSGHNRSYSSVHLSPNKSAANGFSFSNGASVKKATSNNSLYTHTETSRETSPATTPHENYEHYNQYPAFEQNSAAFQEKTRSYQHTHSHSWSPMKKSRPRGDSDLSQPATQKSQTYTPALNTTTAASTSWFSLPEALTSLLVPLPYLLASGAYSSMSLRPSTSFPPFSIYQRAEQTAMEDSIPLARSAGILESCILTSGTLLVVGFLAKVNMAEQLLDRRKELSTQPSTIGSFLSVKSFYAMTVRSVSVALPFYAAMQLGGMRVSLILLIAIATGLTCATEPTMSLFAKLQDVWSSKIATSAAIVLCFILDEAGFTIQNSLSNVFLGYVALITSILVLQPPFTTLSAHANVVFPTEASNPLTPSPLIYSTEDVNVTIAAGLILAIITIGASIFFATALTVPYSSLLLIAITVIAMASAILFSRPTALRSHSKAGLALGCLATASCSFLYSPSLWPGTVCNGGLSALSFLSVLYDTHGAHAHKQSHIGHKHDHSHNVHKHHQHQHQHIETKHSAFTAFIMARCEPGSLISSILSEKDSRRIAYFTVLNFGFMIVQGAYGYLSGSLGLLSDTVHMFFDCAGLVVGLGAAVASKWPNSPEKPHGWGKLNTLAGFGNGVFLMLVSIEFVWEAIEGMLEQTELRHVKELLVVSALGLLVNMVGLFAFGHAHAGHDHGHSHGHSHSHAHEEHIHTHGEHNHAHGEHNHTHTNGHAHSHECGHEHTDKSPSSGGHDHNENMHGIYLHVAADAGGSLAVIVSTALTLWKPWYLWDPLATIIIAILIFAAAIPLVMSSGQKLLLVIPDDLEYNIKNMLQELGELRGVVGYAAPRFWIDDKEEAGDSHGHHHGHDHGAQKGKQKIQGVIHVIAAPLADLQDVLQRVDDFIADRDMDILIHVEREGDGHCWCSGELRSG